MRLLMRFRPNSHRFLNPHRMHKPVFNWYSVNSSAYLRTATRQNALSRPLRLSYRIDSIAEKANENPLEAELIIGEYRRRVRLSLPYLSHEDKRLIRVISP